MRWLQWSTVDLENGLGGVEVHARCLARELRELGCRPALSGDPLDPAWDVVHTHGSSPLSLSVVARLRARRRRPVILHTLHGTTLGRMQACAEWTWPGGYAAISRELQGVLQADAVLGVHAGIGLLPLARKLGKCVEVCGNGWDAALQAESFPGEEAVRGRWLYVGRGEDPVKGASALLQSLDSLPEVQLAVAPGVGFPARDRILKLGALTSGQVQRALMLSEGLVLPSLYEGMPLVVLEALAAGVPVLARRVGGLTELPVALQGQAAGMTWADGLSVEGWSQAWRRRLAEGGLGADSGRAVRNQAFLMRWRQVAGVVMRCVRPPQEGR